MVNLVRAVFTETGSAESLHDVYPSVHIFYLILVYHPRITINVVKISDSSCHDSTLNRTAVVQFDCLDLLMYPCPAETNCRSKFHFQLLIHAVSVSSYVLNAGRAVCRWTLRRANTYLTDFVIGLPLHC
jgi:hypothetical protein